MKPESYHMQERRLLEHHIQAFFGRIGTVLHEALSPDISADIGIIPPSKERSYHTLVSLGESSAAPKQEQRKTDSIQFLLLLPASWNPGDYSEEQHWPVRLLAGLAASADGFSAPPSNGTLLKTDSPLWKNMPMSHTLLLSPPPSSPEGCCCQLPGGKTAHFYQAIPLYPDEAEYGYSGGLEALFALLDLPDLVTDPLRRDSLDCDEISLAEINGTLLDDGSWHLETIQEKCLPVNPLSAFNHMAVWISWFKNHGFLIPELDQRIPSDPEKIRSFIRDHLDGQLLCSYFRPEIQGFADGYYSGENGSCFLSDLDILAREYFRLNYLENESPCARFPEESYLFLPYDDAYIKAVSEIIDHRWKEWNNLGS